MQKLISTVLLGAMMLLGATGCKPGVYHPFGGGPNGAYYEPAKGLPPAKPVPLYKSAEEAANQHRSVNMVAS